MAEKTQVMRPGGFKRGQPLYQHFRVTVEVGVTRVGQRLNNFSKTERHTAPAMVQKSKGFSKSRRLNAWR